MAPSGINVVEILRCLLCCLRHPYEFFCLAISNLAQLRSWCAAVLFQHSRDTRIMANQSVWRKRLTTVAGKGLDFLWIIFIYLLSELTVWGLSQAFAPAKLEFFSSICGMALIFVIMTSLGIWSATVNEKYLEYGKPKIDFINSHLGLGFPIPLIMLNKEQILESHDIGRIIGNFVITNIASWTLVFAISLLIMTLAMCHSSRSLRQSYHRRFTGTPFSTKVHPSLKSIIQYVTGVAISDGEKSWRSSNPSPEVGSCFADTARQASVDGIRSCTTQDFSLWTWFVSAFPLLASFFCIFAVGTPVAAAFKEHRILDGSVLWFVWILTTCLHRGFHRAHCRCLPLRFKSAAVTLMNPVLMTTLLMTTYLRLKAVAYTYQPLSEILDIFSGGTPLYTLWTAAVTSKSLPSHASSWFGAGDAALSILECGIVIWGFKLYEYQGRVFSIAGLFTILISTLSAAGSVFLSVLSGRIIGLKTPEALSFSARSTTLALAKPAIEAVGGNLGANAALVVSNGILGQLVYPFALRKLGMKGDDKFVETPEHAIQDERDYSKVDPTQFTCEDSPVTIAAGIAIGINGAAMGVSYLYETRNRSAPYAALSMTVFGIMTVVFTTVEPFRSVVIGLAMR
ncbi:hypothetical protein BGZ63DRAFT_479014 [Mariannaea sp. PMI_226]|nr:hypothetical protein BGZ63DRAFT_479014 [Mariannaea sp. PMI_226]